MNRSLGAALALTLVAATPGGLPGSAPVAAPAAAPVVAAPHAPVAPRAPAAPRASHGESSSRSASAMPSLGLPGAVSPAFVTSPAFVASPPLRVQAVQAQPLPGEKPAFAARNARIAFQPAPFYWGGAFWGPWFYGTIADDMEYGSITDTAQNVSYPSYEVGSSSPGAQLLAEYGLEQTQCGGRDLVELWGPDKSVVCAIPNARVPAGNYAVDTATLTLHRLTNDSNPKP